MYKGHISIVDALKQRSETASALITDEMRAVAFGDYGTRLGLCTWRPGGHVEALVSIQVGPCLGLIWQPSREQTYTFPSSVQFIYLNTLERKHLLQKSVWLGK